MGFDSKCYNDKFESLEEFIDNLNRGGEIEFVFEGNNYSITHPEGKLHYIKVGDDSSEKFLKNINELLNFKINGKKISDIVTVIQPTFRSF